MNSKEIYKMYKQIDQMINQLYNNGYINVCTPGKNFKECLYQYTNNKKS